MEEKDWEQLAKEYQLHFFESLGSRPYDEIEKNNLFLLKKKVGFATCGKPSELPSLSNFNTGYKPEQLDHIKSVCNKIIEKSSHDPILFSCTILSVYYKGEMSETPVFRIVNNKENIFIDAHARVYQNWQHFVEKNKLPDCRYCFPISGVYERTGQRREPFVEFAFSPASQFFCKATDMLDSAGSVASVAAASVFAAGMVVTVGPAVAAAAATTAACTGVYGLSRSIGSLYDRKQHEQSIGLKDPESRSAWMSVGSSVVGMATMGAIDKAKKVVESGKSMTKLGLFGLHTLTAASLAFSGFGFVETLFTCVNKYEKGLLTKKDVFDLSCELLFLFNAIASAKATTELVKTMSTTVAETPSAGKKLTKTQKRNLRKRAAKRRAKGLAPKNVTEQKESTNFKISSTLQFIIWEAVRAYAPRVEEILYSCQSIGHDILSWKLKEISLETLLANLTRTGIRLYNNYEDEVSEIITKLVKYLSSVTSSIMDQILKYFQNASEVLKSFFCSTVINVEDEIESSIYNAEMEIIELHENLGITNVEQVSETNSADVEDLDDDDLSPETQVLLDGCRSIVETRSCPCNDLKDFSDILEAVKLVVISDFKENISNYKHFLTAAKSASGDSFDINLFNRSLGIKGDVGQHMYDKTISNLTKNDDAILHKIKETCREIESKRNPTITPIWEGLTKGMYHYFGPHGAGYLSEFGLLSLVGGILNKNLIHSNCKVRVKDDVVMIETASQEANDSREEGLNIVIYQGITEENTASGIIVVVE